MVKAVAVVVDRDSTLREQLDDVLVSLEEIGMRGLSLGRAWLVRDNNGTVIEVPDTTDCIGRRGHEPNVRLDIRTFEGPIHGVPDELDEDSVSVEEDGSVAHRSRVTSTDSHFAGAFTSAG